MTTPKDRWEKLAKSKKYREEFVAAQVKRGIPFQIRTLMKKQKLSQEELASRAGLAQGVVSRASNLNYGNLTLNTIIRVAAGLDVAFIGKFVPFSELDRWFATLSEESLWVKTFNDEDAELSHEKLEKKRTGAAIQSDTLQKFAAPRRLSATVLGVPAEKYTALREHLKPILAAQAARYGDGLAPLQSRLEANMGADIPSQSRTERSPEPTRADSKVENQSAVGAIPPSQWEQSLRQGHWLQ